MGSPFDAAARAADAVQACVFGEPVQILPQVARNRHGLAGTDNTRPVMTVTGVFTKAPDSEALEGTRKGSDARGFTSFSGYETKLWLSAEVYGSLGYALRKDDVIALVDRAGQRWQIVKAGPATDVGDITLILADESEAA
jgi:hypothetical protein